MMDFTGTGGTLDNAKEKITVAVRRNGDFKKKDSPIPPFTLEHEWLLPFLLQRASKHLEMYPEADTVYTEHGDEILNCLLIEENDTLFFLQKGEKFKTPPGNHFFLMSTIYSIIHMINANFSLPYLNPHL